MANNVVVTGLGEGLADVSAKLGAATGSSVVKAAASQSASTLELQNSNGIALTTFTSSGNITVLGGSGQDIRGHSSGYTYFPTGILAATLSSVHGTAEFVTNVAAVTPLMCRALSATAAPLVVRGFTSQSAPLLQLQGQSSTTPREQADIDTAWATSTDATRKARLLLRVWDTAAREGLRIEASGTAPMIGFLGAAAVVQQANASQAAINLVADANAQAALQAIFNLLVAYGLAPATA